MTPDLAAAFFTVEFTCAKVFGRRSTDFSHLKTTCSGNFDSSGRLIFGLLPFKRSPPKLISGLSKLRPENCSWAAAFALGFCLNFIGFCLIFVGSCVILVLFSPPSVSQAIPPPLRPRDVAISRSSSVLSPFSRQPVTTYLATRRHDPSIPRLCGSSPTFLYHRY